MFSEFISQIDPFHTKQQGMATQPEKHWVAQPANRDTHDNLHDDKQIEEIEDVIPEELEGDESSFDDGDYNYDGARSELREAPDGGFYTHEEFLEHYGRDDEWLLAKLAQQTVQEAEINTLGDVSSDYLEESMEEDTENDTSRTPATAATAATTATAATPAEPPLSPNSMERHKHMLTLRKINAHIKSNMIKVNNLFQQFDTSGDGMLSKVEFRKGIEAILANALFTISNEEINSLFNSIDIDRSNAVSYREFLQKLRDSDPKRQASLAAKLLAKPTLAQQQVEAREEKKKQLDEIKRAKKQMVGLDGDENPLDAVSKKARDFLKKNMQKAINLFRQMDTSGDGLVDEDELREGLKILGLDLTEEEFQGLWMGLDADGSGACDLKEIEAALRDTDPIRKKALEFYSRPPKLKPRNSLSRAIANRDRRVPGSLSWINSPKTPLTFMKSANPAYAESGENVPLWQNSGIISTMFPTVFKNVPHDTLPSIENLSPLSSPEKSRSPVRREMPESAQRRHRNELFMKKTKLKNSRKHLATIEEKVLRSVMMREGYLHELRRTFKAAEPQTYIHKKKHPFLDYGGGKKKKKEKNAVVKRRRVISNKTTMDALKKYTCALVNFDLQWHI